VAETVALPATEQLGPVPAIPWPGTGSAALRVPGLGWLGTSGAATPRPMASTAKIMTALVVLEDHPLALNQAGPSITITAADVAAYDRDVALDESSLAVAAGEELSELQLLEGLLIPSAGNFGDILAEWDAGSSRAFVQRMNQRAGVLGMRGTQYADATGFDPATVSVPVDLVVVAETAMRLPVFAQIVNQASVVLPRVGLVHSTDHLLGQAGIVGIKTGHTDAAGGNFVFAAQLPVGIQVVRLDGAVMNQPSLDEAFAATLRLIRAVTPHLHLSAAIDPRLTVASLRTAWGPVATVHADRAAALVMFDGMIVHRIAHLSPVQAPLSRGAIIGSLSVHLGDEEADGLLTTIAALPLPTVGWRIFRR
jgi:D-alanyl-D-alanine carboxypeptidase (penicillin-binding protein 5/6)